MTLRLIIKGKQGEGKTTLATAIREMLNERGVSCSVQDGAEQTKVHKAMGAPVSVAIIVKQG